MLTADFDFAFFFSGLREIVGKLHSQPRFGCAPEGLRKPNRHLGADPRLSVNNVVQSLPANPKYLCASRDGQAQRFKTCASYDASRVGGMFHGHSVSPDSVIVDQCNVKRTHANKPENDTPVRPHGHGPKPSEVAFERVKAIAGKVKMLRGRGCIEKGQYLLYCVHQVSSTPAVIVALIESFQAAMLEASNHRPLD
jgi:hypothetical protein